MTDTNDDMTDEEILSAFHLLNVTVGLSRTRLGYAACGQPGLVRAMEKGRRIHPATRHNLTVVLRSLIQQHAEKIPDEMLARIRAADATTPALPSATQSTALISDLEG